MQIPRHKICSCCSEWHTHGKPVKCVKKSATTNDSQLVLKECIVGCGCYHFYNTETLKKWELSALLDKLGIDLSLKVLSEYFQQERV